MLEIPFRQACEANSENFQFQVFGIQIGAIENLKKCEFN